MRTRTRFNQTFLLALFLLTPAAIASEPVRASDDDLPDVTVTATRTERPEATTPRLVTTTTSTDIAERGSRTTPQALAEEVGVFVQETALGGGSPFIRALTGNQIVVLMDGIRINNSAFTRFGPNQYLNTVDPFSVSSIEVTRGPTSVEYGTDALGGVINIQTRAFEVREAALETEVDAYLRYGSAAREKTAAVRLGGSVKGIGISAGGVVQDFDDLSGGRGTGVQTPTGYAAFGADFKVIFPIAGNQTLTVAAQIYEQNNVPRTDRVISGANLKFEFDPQRRLLTYVRWRAQIDGFVDVVEATVHWHRQEEGREEVRASAPDTERRLRDRVDTVGFTANAQKKLGEHRISGGVEVYHDDVESFRVDTDRPTGVETARDGRFPDGSDYLLVAIYLQGEFKFGERWDVIIGGRWSLFDFSASLDDPFTSVDGDDSDFTVSVGITYLLVDGLRAYFLFATGFRAPNLDDLTIFDSFGGGIEIPNPDLNSERSINYELGLKLRKKNVRGTVAVFVILFDDLMQRTPTTFMGSPTFEGEPVFSRQNVTEATVFGLEASGAYRIPETRFTVLGHVAWYVGNDDSNDTPLRRIPPVFGQLTLRWDSADGKLFFEVFGRAASRQDRLSPGDISDPRIPAGGTPGWATLNARGGYTFNDTWTLFVTLENLLDKSYRIHGSGFNAPGTNVILMLRGTF